MAVDADSYGTANGVAALVPQHTNSAGRFDEASEPAELTIEAWINDLSDVINVMLDDRGYTVPATGRLATWLKLFVQQEVAAQVRAIYRRTRRGPNDEESGQQERYRDLLTNINKVSGYLDTLSENLGDQMAFKETDFSGNEVAPIFQREAFGNRFSDWDPD